MSASSIVHEDAFRAGGALGLNHRKVGMWLFISSEVMFFGGLIAAYLHYKVRAAAPPLSTDSLLLVGGNTFVLLASSLMVVLGLAGIRAGRPRRLLVFLGATILLGVLFLSGQAYEFSQLAQQGFTLTGSVLGSSFFTLTGFHGLHVLIGVAWASALLLGVARGRYSAQESLGIEVFGLYWHFVDIVWIVLFTIIYLI
jgi:heme/copper-type cytochrome/quinol oxidase subunit 3